MRFAFRGRGFLESNHHIQIRLFQLFQRIIHLGRRNHHFHINPGEFCHLHFLSKNPIHLLDAHELLRPLQEQGAGIFLRLLPMLEDRGQSDETTGLSCPDSPPTHGLLRGRSHHIRIHAGMAHYEVLTHFRHGQIARIKGLRRPIDGRGGGVFPDKASPWQFLLQIFEVRIITLEHPCRAFWRTRHRVHNGRVVPIDFLLWVQESTDRPLNIVK